jgi:hypothetical protein
MAWVKVVAEEEATGLVKQIYQRSKRGSVQSEVVKVFSLRPELMDLRVRFGDRMTFGGSGLGRYREELIAVSISAICQCRY